MKYVSLCSMLVAVKLVQLSCASYGRYNPVHCLTILEKRCTTINTGQIRYLAGSNLLQVCSKGKWRQYSPYKRLRSGLVGHWKMDEQTGNAVDDDSGHSHHGIATTASPKPAKFTRGRYFDGNSNAVITIPNSPELNFGTGSFSFAGWQKLEDLTYPRTTFSVRKGFGCYFKPGRPGWFPGFETAYAYQPLGTYVCIRDHLNNKVLATLKHDDPYKPPNLLHKWTHYVFTFDRVKGKVTLFLNGRKQSNTVDISSVTGSINNNKPLLFGWQYGWKTKGTLDEYRFYNYVLSYYEAKLVYLDHRV